MSNVVGMQSLMPPRTTEDYAALAAECRRLCAAAAEERAETAAVLADMRDLVTEWRLQHADRLARLARLDAPIRRPEFYAMRGSHTVSRRHGASRENHA